MPFFDVKWQFFQEKIAFLDVKIYIFQNFQKIAVFRYEITIFSKIKKSIFRCEIHFFFSKFSLKNTKKVPIFDVK